MQQHYYIKIELIQLLVPLIILFSIVVPEAKNGVIMLQQFASKKIVKMILKCII